MCAGICQAEDIRERIERLRRHLYHIYERCADEREILAVSRELDRLIIELLRLDHDAGRPTGASDAS